MARDCKHGQLARSCEICGLEADLESQAEYIKELQARLAWLQKTLTGRQRRHYASALRQLRNFRDGLREARALYAEKSGKPDRFDDPSAWWQNPRDKCVVLWLLEWAEDVQADLIEQLGKERDALAAEVERLRYLRRWWRAASQHRVEEQTPARSHPIPEATMNCMKSQPHGCASMDTRLVRIDFDGGWRL